MPSFSSLGIGSGLNLNDILKKIIDVEAIPLNRLAAREKEDTDHITALGRLKSTVATFGDAAAAFAKKEQVNTLTLSSSNSTSVEVQTNGPILPGEYDITVQQLAVSQKLRSAGFSGTTDAVGEGTLHIELGSYNGTFVTKQDQKPINITIDAHNHSLAGIRDEINKASIGITANIIQDGSTKGAYLVVSSDTTGTKNTILIRVTPPVGSTQTNLSQLAFDPTQAVPTGLTQIQAAQDALFSLDGLAVQSNENVVSNTIAGVTLTLKKITDSSQPVRVSIVNNYLKLKPLLQSFVTTYNTVLDALDQAAQKGSALRHDSTVHTLQRTLYDVLTIPVQTTGSTMGRLSDLGVSSDKTGHLSFQEDLFTKAIAQPGFSATEFFMGRVSSSSRYVTVEANQDSKTTDLLVSHDKNLRSTETIDILTGATQGFVRGDFLLSEQNGVTITQGDNDTLSFTVNGKTESITIAAGHYTPEQVQQLFNAACQGNAALKNISVTLTTGADLDHSQLVFTNAQYGQDSTVTIQLAGAALSLLGDSISSAGHNVVVAYNGQQITGQGQVVDIKGWRVQITTPTPEMNVVIEFEPGFGQIAQRKLTEVLDKNGPLLQGINGLNEAIKKYNHQKEALRAQLDALQAQYKKQFQALDLYITKMTQTSNFIRSVFNKVKE